MSKLGHDRTKNAISARKYKLTGTGYAMYCTWSKEEDDIILSSNSTNEAFDKLSKMGYFRTNNAINQRRSLLNKSNVKNN